VNRPKNVDVRGFATIEARITCVADILDLAEYLKHLGVEEDAETDTHAGKVWVELHETAVTVEDIECASHVPVLGHDGHVPVQGQLHFDLLLPLHKCDERPVEEQSVHGPVAQYDYPRKDRGIECVCGDIDCPMDWRVSAGYK
jgi:hypothetical protein